MPHPTSLFAKTLATACLSTALLTASASATVVLFEDNFSNDVVANSDAITGFWNPVNSSFGSATEDDGSLIVSLPGSDNTTVQTRTVRSHDSAGPHFNFFAQELTFSVSGLSVTNPGVGDVGINGGNSVFQFFLSPATESNPTSANGTTDLIGVRIRANNRVELGFKQDGGTTGDDNVFGSLYLEHNVTYTAPVTGFALTLNATSYSLFLTFDDINTPSTTITDTHGLTQGTWGTGETLGESSIGLVTQSFISSGKANDTLVTLNSLTVTSPIPEPSAAAALLGLGALGLAALRRRRRA